MERWLGPWAGWLESEEGGKGIFVFSIFVEEGEEEDRFVGEEAESGLEVELVVLPSSPSSPSTRPRSKLVTVVPDLGLREDERDNEECFLV